MAESPIPDISVIIPVLDNEDGLRACVHALQQQSLPSERFEIIVVDNGSEDGTLEAAGELPVRLFSQVERSEEHTSELQSRGHLVCRLLLEKKKTPYYTNQGTKQKARTAIS